MQNSYIINYDLRNKRDYNALYRAIKSYPNWGKVLESCWVIKSENSAVQVRDHLASYMDSDDGLFVVKSANEAAWKGILCDDQWLKDNI